MRFDAAGKTDVGRVREINEDSFGMDAERGIFLVADGMGGHQAGEIASRLLVEKALERYAAGFNPRLKEKEIRDLLAEGIRKANRAIVDLAETDRAKRGMGSTVVALLFDEKRYYIGWVGDSRVYLMRKGELKRLTKDHSRVQALVDAGVITAAEALKHPNRNEITRAVGVRPEVEVDVVSDKAREGDVFLLCTDGVFGDMADEEFRGNISSGDQAGEMASALITRANERGGEDNATVIVVRITDI